MIVAIPYLVRNVIISGYLLYPYSWLDLFEVDWKMPSSVAVYDAMEIMVRGRELKDVTLYDMPFRQWLPIWFESAPQFITVVGLVSALILVIYMIYCLLGRKWLDIRRSLLFVYSIVALFVWLFSAPLLRYGMVYLLIPICGVVWIMLEWRKNNIKLQSCARYVIVFLITPIWCIYISNWEMVEELPKYWQVDYQEHPTVEMEITEGISIWYPTEGDQGGYANFPCIPYSNIVEKLELRGNGLEEGFRIKSEYKKMHLNGYGREW